MNTVYQTKGIILEHKPIGEFDMKVVCFTQGYGSVEVYVKAFRKITSKLRSGLSPFFLSYLEFVEGKNGFILIEAMKERDFSFAVKSPVRLRALYRARDFLKSLAPMPQQDRLLWDFFLASLAALNREDLENRFVGEWERRTKEGILKHSGYAP